MNKKEIALIVIIVLISIVLVIGGTYAYYIANVTGNDTAEDITIASGYLELTFAEDNNIVMENAFPNSKGSKTFTVTNTSTATSEFTYNIKLAEVETDFEQTDLVYELQEYEDDTYETPKEDGINATGFINADTVNEQGEMYLAINIDAPAIGEKQYYKLTIEFKETNENQDYNKGKSFTGKINGDDNRDAKLYEEKTENPFKKVMIVDNETIYDNDPDNNLRYVGQDPSNYIWFNCDDYDFTSAEQATGKNCEKWRIIGLFKNVTKADDAGTEDLVKIIKADSIGNIAWARGESNNWTTASLRTSLNTTYYNGTKLSNGEGIKESTRGMIEKVTWNIGGHSSAKTTAAQFYTAERGSTTYNSQPSTWDGYIGLMYPSDYGYATAGGSNVGRDACLAYSMYSWDSGNYNTDCAGNSWLSDSSTTQWTLTPGSLGSNYVYRVNRTGAVDGLGADSSFTVHPSLYLKSSVQIANGEGTSTEPYIPNLSTDSL